MKHINNYMSLVPLLVFYMVCQKCTNIIFSQNYSFRPIFAAYNTASYKIAKYLVPILSPFTTNEYTIENSYSFSKKICSLNNSNSYYMVSFDIENLFTNIPIRETINICIDYLFPENNSVVCGLDCKSFKTLLEHSVLNSFFIFNSKLYK